MQTLALLTRYIELAEVPEGETIQRLTVCFYNTRLACIEAPAAPLSSQKTLYDTI